MLHENDGLLGSGNESAANRYRFRHGAGINIDVIGRDTKVLIYTATGSAQNSQTMTLVEQYIGVEFFFKRYNFGQWAYVALHREYAFCYDKSLFAGVLGLQQGA